MQLFFGDCRLDPQSRQLFRRNRPVHLTPKAFQLLNVLIMSRPRAVPKAELMEQVWPNTFVSDSSLARAIRELRRAIGDDADHSEVIRTVHAFGYAFAGAVTHPDSEEGQGGLVSNQHWLICGSRDFALMEGENVIGREAGASVRLTSPDVSRRHALIVVAKGRAVLRDLSSRNGTALRGQKIVAPAIIENGDAITVGSFELTYRILRPSDPTATQA